MIPSRRTMATALVVTLLGAALGASASAEPIRVQSGIFGYDTGDPATLIASGEGFDLTAIFLSVETGPHLECASCTEGTPIDLSALVGGEGRDFRVGQATRAVVGGVTYVPPIFPPVRELTGTLRFEAPTVFVPTSAGPGVLLTAPFTFTGTIVGFRDTPLFELDLWGQGTVALNLTRSANGIYSFRAVSYQFDNLDPVPEPATLVLFGLGAAVLYGRRRNRLPDVRP